jgi:hypothetical protein
MTARIARTERAVGYRAVEDCKSRWGQTRHEKTQVFDRAR